MALLSLSYYPVSHSLQYKQFYLFRMLVFVFYCDEVLKYSEILQNIECIVQAKARSCDI